ncbi:MAG: DNRLRE domain-containing protein [Actinomycetota bacterium]|nr:DNRLRE domain-containing protein [Actinomycetota bacterium]
MTPRHISAPTHARAPAVEGAPLHWTYSKSLAVAAAATTLLSGVALLSGTASATTPHSSLRLASVADTYVTSGNPRANFGTANQIQASAQAGHHKLSLIRFQVPALKNQTVVAAHLLLQRSTHHLSAIVSADAVRTAPWTENAVTYRSAPAVAKHLDQVRTTWTTSTVSLDVTAAVHRAALMTIAVTSPSRSTFAAFRSKESGHGPVLELTLQPSAPAVALPPKPTAPSSAAPAPTSSSPSPTQASCVTNVKGIPSAGAYFGAAVSGTASQPALESRTGHSLAIHRTYYAANQVDYAIRSVKAELAAGRLPWISFKLPYPWAAMAAGRGDAWARDLVTKLASVGGPVWLAFHHEPEGDGNLPDWVAMQRHLSTIVHALAPNVAYTVIFTGWYSLFGPTNYRLDKLWPGDRYVDILGMDIYNDYGSNRGGNPSLPMLDPMKYFGVLGPWARAHHVGWAVAETGYTKAAALRNPHWLALEYRDLVAQGGLGLSYFDSSLNSVADWTLSDATRMNDFVNVAKGSARICG